MDFKEEVSKYDYMMTLDEAMEEAERFSENDILDLLHYIAQSK